MRVRIGKYKNGWTGPYQIADWLKLVGIGEDRCNAIGDQLNKTWVRTFCKWIEKRKPERRQKVKIRIDYWDTWNMSETLAQIIAPMLRQLRKDKHGASAVDDEDVPESLRSTSAPAKKDERETDENYFLRWDWVLDEMIWAFEQEEGDGNWEDQYHTGVIDIQWKEINHASPDLKPGVTVPMHEMIHGPKDTHIFDSTGYENHLNRMKNGLRLFGKYYLSLWD